LGVIDFKPDLKELIKFAGTAVAEGKYTMCVQNLEDALKLSAGGDDAATIYKCYADMFSNEGNYFMAKNALFRACVYNDKGGFYTIAYSKFFPEEAIIDDEDFPVPDSDSVLGYNDVYNYFIMGNYDKGLDILCELQPDAKSLDEVLGVLADAIEDGEKIDLSKHTYKLLLLAGIYAAKSGDFVRIMLQGCESSRQIMTDGVDFFVDEIDDKRILTNVGEAFAHENEYECAEKCFGKILEECDNDEISLFYMAAIKFNQGKNDDAEKYWNKYKLCYRLFGTPIKVYERVMRKKIMPEYGVIDESFVKEDAELLSSCAADTPIGDFFEAYENVLAYADEFTLADCIYKKFISPETTVNAIKDLLLSPFVSDARKRFLFGELIESGYEGRVAVATEMRGTITDAVRFHIRNGRNCWNEVFKKVSCGIILCDDFIPYKANFLAELIKKLAKQCTDRNIKAEREDVPFLCEIVAQTYNLHIKNNNNIGWVKIAQLISSEELKRGLQKFPPEVITF
jgi:tetratricopeptide (TPR) repeat protein